MTTRTIIIPTLLAVVLCLPARSQANDLNFTLRGQVTYHTDSSYDPISIDDHAGYGNLSLGYEVLRGLMVFGEYQWGSEVDPLFGFDRFDFTMHAAVLSVQYAYPLFSFLRPHARVGMGFTWGDIDLVSDHLEYDDTAFGIRLFALGGFSVLWEIGDPRAEDRGFFDHLTVGLTTDAGWSFGPWLRFDELTATGVTARTPAIDLGETTLGGFTWDLGLTIRWAL
ncbi:MAG: outer membrane beta-barrel protein [Bradymonadales bacterium]|nr:outer membrane beta-barrel protein [Bradymonadales bacterium]